MTSPEWARDKRKAFEPYEFACAVRQETHLGESNLAGGEMMAEGFHLKAEKVPRIYIELGDKLFTVEMPEELVEAMKKGSNPEWRTLAEKWATGWARGMTGLIGKQLAERGVPLTPEQRRAAEEELAEYLLGYIPGVPALPPPA